MKTNGFSYISIILSLIAIAVSCFLPKPVELDMFNSVITLLALLVTVLIGWQVFQVINFQKEKEEIYKEFDRRMSFIKNEQTLLSSSLFSYYMKEGKDYEVFLQGMEVIRLNLDNDELASTMFTALMEYSEKGFSFQFDYQLREAQNLFMSFKPELARLVPAKDLEVMKERINGSRK